MTHVDLFLSCPPVRKDFRGGLSTSPNRRREITRCGNVPYGTPPAVWRDSMWFAFALVGHPDRQGDD